METVANVRLGFILGMQGEDLHSRYIMARHLEKNGRVDRSHRTDEQDFLGPHVLTDIAEATSTLHE